MHRMNQLQREVGIHFLAQRGDVKADRVRIAFIVRPDALQNILPRQRPALVPRQRLQERVLAGGQRQFLPAALLLKGRVLAARGEPGDAEAVLAEAGARAEELGFRRLLWEIDWQRSRLAIDRGDEPAAAELASRAASILRRMAETIDDDDLRASFLALPSIRAVLDVG